jgi:hypothetical protein
MAQPKFITLENNLVSFYPVRNDKIGACNAAMKLENWHDMRLSIDFTNLHEYMKMHFHHRQMERTHHLRNLRFILRNGEERETRICVLSIFIQNAA